MGPSDSGGAPVGSNSPGCLDARVLGGFDVTVDGRRLGRADWQRLSAVRLLKLLLVAEDHAVLREVAIDALWPDADAEGGRASLRKAVHFLRRALGHSGMISGEGSLIRLDPPRLDLDLDRLRASLDQLSRPLPAPVRAPAGRPTGPAGSDDDGSQALAVVLDLGGHVLLPDDAYEDWLVAPREHLRTRWQVLALEAAERAAAAGRHADAHVILEQILDRDPTDEAAHRLAIAAYAAEGRHHAARRQFELCRQALLDGLDAEPSAATVAAHRSAEADAARRPPVLTRVRLVARHRELEQIESLLDRVSAGRFAGLAIRGPAGVGKTRLLDEVREYARGLGWRELWWQAIGSTRHVPFAPFATRLGSVASAAELDALPEPARSAASSVAPGLGVQGGLTFADRSAMMVALADSVARLAHRAPLLVAIDDVAWLDEASSELLATLATFAADDPILVAVTCRDEESRSDAAASVLGQLRRSGGAEIVVRALAERDIEPLVLGHLGGETVAPGLVAMLFAQSAGNPLFCLEVARAARERGAVLLERGRWSIAPGEALHETTETVRELVAQRCRTLVAPALELLRTAALLGPEIRYDTLAAVTASGGDGLVEALDAALASGLLAEQGSGYTFAHPLYRLALEADAGGGRRARTHLAIARALAARRGLDPDSSDRPAWMGEDAREIAEHALQAWEAGLHEAGPLVVAAGLAAGARARMLFDREVATSLFERALRAWEELPREARLRFDASAAYADLAELRLAAGDEAGAHALFRSSIATARDPEELSAAYDRWCWLPYQHGDFAAAIAICDEALARLPATAPAARARIEASVAWCMARLNRFEEAVARLRVTARTIETAGDRRRLGNVLDRLGTLLPHIGLHDEAVATLERAVALALEVGDTRMELARIHLASVLARAGRAAEARPHAQRGLELAHQMGEWYLESVAAWFAAETEDALGNLAAARELRLRELALLGRIGGNPHNEAYTRAHLAHLARCAGDEQEGQHQAAIARRLAAADREPGYALRIEHALSVERWSNLLTG